MKKILFVSLFADPLSENNSRLNSVYDYSQAEKLIITADFDHSKKEYRSQYSKNRNVVCLHVPRYKTNISLGRLYSHVCFAKQLDSFFNTIMDKPDVVYCAMPSSTAAFVCAKYCKRLGIKLVIDVIDLWPDSLIPVNRFFKIFKYLLFPWKYITIFAYKSANIIIGESHEYVNIAHKYNFSAPVYPAYLGVNQEQIDNLRRKSNIHLEKPKDEIWICYAGSLGNSYDFESLLKAVKRLEGTCTYKLYFVGGGEKQSYLEAKLREYNINGEITGNVSYSDYLKYLSYCDIGINVFKKDTLVVHSYKFNDYVASRLFILNSLEGETAEMIDQYEIGKNFDFADNSLIEVLYEVCSNWFKYKEFRQNNTRLVEEILDKKKIYSELMSTILKC